MIAGSIARRYAKAVLDLGIAKNSVEALGRELDVIGSLFADNRELRQALTNPIIKSSQKRAILEELATRHGFSPDIRHFLSMLADRNRLFILPDLARELRVLVDENQGRVRALVISATPLSDEQESKLRASLEKQTGKKVLVERREDPELIGGITVQVGDMIWDGSVAKQLEVMKESILKEEQHFA